MSISEESKNLATLVGSKGVKLSSGVVLPPVGFGTWDIGDNTQSAQAVKTALSTGYRLIDGAAFYGNEVGVGEGIAAALSLGLKRSELFITSKVWVDNLTYDKAQASCKKTLCDLKLDYLDLLLIHWPVAPKHGPDWVERNVASWRAFCELQDAGLVKHIGVSNFKQHHLQALLETGRFPQVNQLEIHPGYSQHELVKFCQGLGMVVEAWSPFGRGAVLGHELLKAIASKHGVTVAQVCLRFAYQLGVVSLPKSSNQERMLSNLDFFNFTLSEEEMQQLLALDAQKVGYSGEDPD